MKNKTEKDCNGVETVLNWVISVGYHIQKKVLKSSFWGGFFFKKKKKKKKRRRRR